MITYLKKIFLYKEIVNNKKRKNTNGKIKKKTKKSREWCLPPHPR